MESQCRPFARLPYAPSFKIGNLETMEVRLSKWIGISLRIANGVKNIPYTAEPESGVHPVVWLTKEPHRLDEIPELQEDATLKQLVVEANSPGRRFETFRCLATEELDEDGQWSAYRNVGFIYRNRQWFQDYGSQMMVVGEILGFALESIATPDNGSPFAVELQQANLKEEGIRGWSVDVWLQQRAGTREEASNLAGELLRILVPILGRRIGP